MNKVLMMGKIQYKEKVHFESAVDCLTKNNLLQDGHFVDIKNNEVDYVTSDTLHEVDDVNLALKIPLHYYANLKEVITQIFEGGDGEVSWVNVTDDKAEAGHIKNGNEICYDLIEWMIENAGETKSSIPSRNSNQWPEWVEDAEMDFLTNFQLF
jgi:hypothetical protein